MAVLCACVACFFRVTLRIMRCVFVALALIACGPPPEGTCEGAPASASIDSIEIRSASDVVPENGLVPYLRGVQGADMVQFGIAYLGADVPECLRRRLIVRTMDGAGVLGWDSTTTLYPSVDDAEPHVEPETIVEPPRTTLIVEVEAYGTRLERTVSPTAEPRPLRIDGPTTAVVGSPVVLTVVFDGPTPARIPIDILIEPSTAGTFEPAELALAYTATEVSFNFTAVEPGPLTVIARGNCCSQASTTITAQ